MFMIGMEWSRSVQLLDLSAPTGRRGYSERDSFGEVHRGDVLGVCVNLPYFQVTVGGAFSEIASLTVPYTQVCILGWTIFGAMF